jgi:hypothetical protein
MKVCPTTMNRTPSTLKLLLCLALLGGGMQAGAATPDPRQRTWQLHEFTTLKLVPREAGAPPNQQPAALSAEVLRQQLAQVQGRVGAGTQPLFANDELAELAEPLAQALGNAGAGDDVLLLSSSTRGGGILTPPTAVVARLFVQDGRLQLIVHDVRFDFYDTYRGTHTPPTFTYGSRAAAGPAVIQSAGAANRRADWLAIPLQPVAAAAPPPAPPAPGSAATVAPPPPPAVPAPAAATPARKPLDAAGAEEIERRLETLKRLRDKGLISEDEYQQKRREILQLL